MERTQGAAASDRADVLGPDVGLSGNGSHADPFLNGDRPSDAEVESAFAELLPDHLEFGLRPDVELLPGGDTVADIDGADESVRQSASPEHRRARRRAEQAQSQGLPSRQPPGPAPLKEVPQTPSEARSLPDKPSALKGPVPTESVTRPEWCSIVLAATYGRTAEFRIVMLEPDGQRHLIGHSASFRVARSRPIRDRGQARVAHDGLVADLLADGWRRLEARGRWHDTAFIRYPREL